MTTTSQSSQLSREVPALESRHVVQVYRRAPIVVTHGRGSWLYDADGREYLDLGFTKDPARLIRGPHTDERRTRRFHRSERRFALYV